MPTLIAAGSGSGRPRGGAASRRTPRRRGGVHPGGRHVRGRVAELAAALVALDDLAAHREGTSQRLRGALDVTGREAVPDVRRRPDLRTAVERDPLGHEVVALPRLAQGADVAGGAVAEPEVGADHHRLRVERVDQDLLDEPLGRPGRDVAGERHHEQVVHPRVREQHRARLHGGQGGARVLGAQHRDRVRVEGDRDQVLHAAVAGHLAGAPHHVLVTEVYPVEVADRHDRPTEVGGNVVDRAPDPHVRGAPVLGVGRVRQKPATRRAPRPGDLGALRR